MPRPSAQLRLFRIRDVFDPDDELSMHVAALAMLAQDMRVALYMMEPETRVSSELIGTIKGANVLMSGVKMWLIALESADGVLQKIQAAIRTQPDEFLAGHGFEAGVTDALNEATSTIAKVRDELKHYRNKTAGHMDAAAVRRAVAKIAPTAQGRYWIGTLRHCDMDFASQIAVMVMCEPTLDAAGVPQPEIAPWFYRTVLDHCFHTYEAIHAIVALYLGRQLD